MKWDIRMKKVLKWVRKGCEGSGVNSVVRSG